MEGPQRPGGASTAPCWSIFRGEADSGLHGAPPSTFTPGHPGNRPHVVGVRSRHHHSGAFSRGEADSGFESTPRVPWRRGPALPRQARRPKTLWGRTHLESPSKSAPSRPAALSTPLLGSIFRGEADSGPERPDLPVEYLFVGPLCFRFFEPGHQKCPICHCLGGLNRSALLPMF